MRTLLLLPLVMIHLAACAASESLPPPPPPPEPAPGANMSGKAHRRLANCPSAVPGAITKVALDPRGVDVTITAPSPEAQRTIVALAEFHARTPRPLDATPHVGLRGGGSRVGYCPILHDGVLINATPVPGGVRLHLRATSPSLDRVRELQQIVFARAARFSDFPQS